MKNRKPTVGISTGTSQDIVPLLFALCLAAPFGIHLLWDFALSSAETGDKLTWVSVVFSVGMCGLAADRSCSNGIAVRTPTGALAAIATIFFAGTLATLNVLGGLSNHLWFGFGQAGAGCFLICSFLLYRLRLNYSGTQGFETATAHKWTPSKIWDRALLGLTVCASAFFYGPFLLQPSWGVVDRIHSRYVINEIVGPLAGNWGMGNHIPQYTSALGIPLLFLRPFEFTTAQIYAVAAAYISGLSVLTGSLIFALSWKLSAPATRPVMPFFTLGLALAAQARPLGHLGSITSLMSAVPGRMLPILLVFTCLFQFGKSASVRSASSLGAAVGFCLTNNFEFGVSTAASVLLVLFVLRASSRNLMFVAGAALSVTGSYFAMIAIDGNSVNVSSWVLFSLGFGSGFGGVPMPKFGVWIPVLAVFAFAAVLSVYRIRHLRTSAARDSRLILPVYILVLVASSNGLLQFGYYAGRSVNSGQLQILLIYLALVSAGLSHEVFRVGASSASSRWVFVMLVALPALALPSTRWPLSEWARVSGHSRSVTLESEDTMLLGDADLIAQLLEGRDPDDFVLLLEGSNLHSIGSGLDSIAPTNSPKDYPISRQIGDEICSAIEGEDRFVVTTTESRLGEASPAWCGASPITAGVPPNLVILSNPKSR